MKKPHHPSAELNAYGEAFALLPEGQYTIKELSNIVHSLEKMDESNKKSLIRVLGLPNETRHSIAYCIGYRNAVGKISTYMIHNCEVFNGSQEQAIKMLEQIKKKVPAKEWKIYILSELV